MAKLERAVALRKDGGSADSVLRCVEQNKFSFPGTRPFGILASLQSLLRLQDYYQIRDLFAAVHLEPMRFLGWDLNNVSLRDFAWIHRLLPNWH